MKNGLPVNPVLFKMVVLITCFMLVMFYNKSQGATAAETTAMNHTIASK